MADRSVCVLLLSVCSLGLVAAVSKVHLGVYYESMCPDSKAFFREQLWPTYKQMAPYLDVELIPYGNAHYQGKPGKYSFSCQHGPEECYGNLVQTCFIEMVNDTRNQIKMINCAFDSPSQKKSMDRCMPSEDVRRQVKKCVTSDLGPNLEYEMAKKTDALSPPHNFIPWITVEGDGSRDITEKAIDDLKSLVCEKLKDLKLDICNKKWSPWSSIRNAYL